MGFTDFFLYEEVCSELWNQMKTALDTCLAGELSIGDCVKGQLTIALQKIGISMKF